MSMIIDNVKVFCGLKHTTFVINDEIYACGASSLKGTEKSGGDEINLIPKKYIFEEGKIDSIYYGVDHAVAKFYDGSIWSWGSNTKGELGLGSNENYTVPQKIMFDFGHRVTSVSCGGQHTMIVTEKGDIYGWGYNYSDQLGLGNSVNCNLPTKLSLSDVKSVNCGSGHTMILTLDGCGYSCGTNVYGQLGLGDNEFRVSLHKLKLSNIISISCGDYYTIALTSSGVYSWGSNLRGQLGLGDCKYRFAPQKIDLSSFVGSLPDILSIGCSCHRTMILTSKGELFACGDSIGSFKFQKLNLNEFIIEVKCSYKHAIITTKSGKYYGWGYNGNGQLGLGDTMGGSVPTEMLI